MEVTVGGHTDRDSSVQGYIGVAHSHSLTLIIVCKTRMVLEWVLAEWVGGVEVRGDDIKMYLCVCFSTVVSRWALQEGVQFNRNWLWYFLFEPSRDKHSPWLYLIKYSVLFLDVNWEQPFQWTCLNVGLKLIQENTHFLCCCCRAECQRVCVRWHMSIDLE